MALEAEITFCGGPFPNSRCTDLLFWYVGWFSIHGWIWKRIHLSVFLFAFHYSIKLISIQIWRISFTLFSHRTFQNMLVPGLKLLFAHYESENHVHIGPLALFLTLLSQQRRYILSQSGARKTNRETVINNNWQSFGFQKKSHNCANVSQKVGL